MADYYVSTIGNDTTGDGTVGNPYATPGKALGVAIAAASAGFRVLVKADGTYTTSTNTAHIAGGRLNFSLSGTQAAFNWLIGYTTTVGDGGKFTFALGSGLAGPLITTNNANSFNEIRNVNMTGNSTSGASAMALQGRSNRVINWKASGFTGGNAHIVAVSNNATISQWEISGGNTSTFGALTVDSSTNANVSDGWQHGNAGRGINIAAVASITIHRVASSDNTGANGHNWFMQGATEAVLRGCASWNAAQSGIKINSSNASLILDDCIIGGNAAYDVDNNSAANSIILRRCKIKTSTSGQFQTTPTTNESPTTLTGVPFVDYANGNFALNSTAGAGADCKATSATLFGLTATYADSGLSQSQASGGGASSARIFNGM